MASIPIGAASFSQRIKKIREFKFPSAQDSKDALTPWRIILLSQIYKGCEI